ncbi:MAG: thiamine pyrophosphate-binding protein [Promethearchaeota archaeon]|jgi:acetolactate synthase-1/2/3 large subunit
MGLVNGGTLFGKALVNEGVEKAFVLVGGHILPILQGMRREGIEVIDMRHECSAMYAAIACARVTGKPVAVATTAGPGSLNAVPGMMEAIGCCMPIIHIGGATSIPEMDTASLQDMPTLIVQETCSKWARRVTRIEKIPFYVSMALRHAMEGNPGPVYIEAPSDIVYRTVEEEKVFWPEKGRPNTIPHGDFASVEAAADLLVNAKRPAAIFGDGARFNIGVHVKDVAALSDYLKMPMRSQNACKGLFGSEYDNPLLKTSGLGEADVILSMGMRWDYRIGYGRFISKQTKIIQVHTDATQIGFNVRADIGIVGGVGPVTSQILQAVRRKRDKPVEKSWIKIPEGNSLDRVSEKMQPSTCGILEP